MSHLTSHALAFERNQQTLFENINFTLNAGDLLQLRGANGSGKSTLLRMLAGFIEPQQGEIRWNNIAVMNQLEHYQQCIQYLGHQNGAKTYLTVQENLQLQGALHNKTFSEQDLHHALTRVGLSHLKQTPAANLSAGQARRLSLAKLILLPATLWLLDEPTTALDSAGHTLLVDLLTQHTAAGGSAIIATHHDLALPHAIQTIWLGDAHA